MKSHAGGAALIAGLVLALGTAGGLDCETISLAQGVTQLVASLVLVTIGSTAAGIFLLKPRRAFLYLIYKNSAFAALGPRAGLYRVLK